MFLVSLLFLQLSVTLNSFPNKKLKNVFCNMCFFCENVHELVCECIFTFLKNNTLISKSSIYKGSTSVDSPNHGLKIFGEKNPRKFPKASLEYIMRWALCWIRVNEVMCRHTPCSLCANTTSFYIRYLSICGFWYSRREWGLRRLGCPRTTSLGYWGMVILFFFFTIYFNIYQKHRA